MPTTTFAAFGQWLRYHRQAERYSMRDLANELVKRGCKISHGYIGKLETDNSGPGDISPRPAASFVQEVAAILGADVNEGLRLAGRLTEGTAVPEGADEYPPELQDALAYAGVLSPQSQKYIYQLWREQAHAHYDIELKRQEAERQLEARQQELNRLRSTAPDSAPGGEQ